LFNIRTELGRERAGITIALSWSFATHYKPRWITGFFLCGMALGLIGIAKYAPKYWMTWSDVAQVGHCHGLGWSPSPMTSPHGNDKKSGTCPFTGAKAV
jgi:hypothetical protein